MKVLIEMYKQVDPDSCEMYINFMYKNIYMGRCKVDLVLEMYTQQGINQNEYFQQRLSYFFKVLNVTNCCVKEYTPSFTFIDPLENRITKEYKWRKYFEEKC